MSKAKDFRVLSNDELLARLVEYKQELFNLRFQNASGQLVNSARVPQVRQDIARINGIVRERQIEAHENLASQGADN